MLVCWKRAITVDVRFPLIVRAADTHRIVRGTEYLSATHVTGVYVLVNLETGEGSNLILDPESPGYQVVHDTNDVPTSAFPPGD